VRDEHLLSLAEFDVLDVDTIRDVLPRGVARRYEEALLDAHDERLDPDGAPPPAAAPAPLGSTATVVVRDLRELARQRAEALGMAPELLARKREVEACVRHYQAHGELSDAYQGWRRDLVGDAFRARLERLR
jgi:ribonuclease D